MYTLEDCLIEFTGSLISHAILMVYLFMIMNTRGRQVLKKLPALVFSPLLGTLIEEIGRAHV